MIIFSQYELTRIINMRIPHSILGVLLFLILLGSSLPSPALAQQKQVPSSSARTEKLRLLKAVMCEGIREQSPKNEAIVFSVSANRVYCFTYFDPVPKNTFIFHNWFYRDKLKKKNKLTAKSPRWATFSRIQVQKGDKGPWRVEIADKEGKILNILRFSITD